jgi:hypothetical protein
MERLGLVIRWITCLLLVGCIISAIGSIWLGFYKGVTRAIEYFSVP